MSERTAEEWQKLFPVLELEMMRSGLKIRLADDKASLSATLPEEMMQTIVAQWQAYQDGVATSPVAFSRHYAGAWNKEE